MIVLSLTSKLIILEFHESYLTLCFVFVSDDESDDDDEDDTEALMAELDQIKKERVEERLRKVKLTLICSMILLRLLFMQGRFGSNICIIHVFQEKQQQMEELNAKEEELLKGNPLLNNAPTSFSVKRRLGFC